MLSASQVFIEATAICIGTSMTAIILKAVWRHHSLNQTFDGEVTQPIEIEALPLLNKDPADPSLN